MLERLIYAANQPAATFTNSGLLVFGFIALLAVALFVSQQRKQV